MKNKICHKCKKKEEELKKVPALIPKEEGLYKYENKFYCYDCYNIVALRGLLNEKSKLRQEKS